MEATWSGCIAGGSNGGRVDACRRQEGLSDGGVEFGYEVGHLQSGMREYGFSYEAVSVGVEAGGGDSDEDVPDVDSITSIDEVASFSDTDAEAGHIEIAGSVEIGHDGSFTTEQCSACLLAAVTDSAYELFEELGVVFSEGDVVEEEEWFGPEAQAVVDAHGNEVNADGVKHTGVNGHFNFGADAVCSGNEDGVLPLTECIESEESGEASGQVHDAWGEGASHQGRQFLHRLFVEFEVDAGRSVGQI